MTMMENILEREEKLIAPKHVAIIMDGNRRWARRLGKEPIEGHHAGADNLIEVVRIAESYGVEVLTVYSFSTENWTRPQNEVSGLMNLFQFYLESQKEVMIEEGIRLEAIGYLDQLPENLQETYNEVREATEGGEKIRLVLALNYGARNEMIRSMKKLFKDIQEGKRAIDDIDEFLFSDYLDTHSTGDPDLLIRTSGEFRISNFLLWQLSYAEIFVTDTLWPDFSKDDFKAALLDYQKRKRRGGS